MTGEKRARIGGFAIGAIVTCIGVIGSLGIGAWGFNLVAGVLSAMTGTSVNVRAAQLEAVLMELRESPSPARRVEAADQLARSSDPRVVEGLARALRDPDSRVERHAALALGQIGDPAVVPALANLLKNGRDEDVRDAAATALGVLHHRRRQFCAQIASGVNELTAPSSDARHPGPNE